MNEQAEKILKKQVPVLYKNEQLPTKKKPQTESEKADFARDFAKKCKSYVKDDVRSMALELFKRFEKELKEIPDIDIPPIVYPCGPEVVVGRGRHKRMGKKYGIILGWSNDAWLSIELTERERYGWDTSANFFWRRRPNGIEESQVFLENIAPAIEHFKKRMGFHE